MYGRDDLVKSEGKRKRNLLSRRGSHPPSYRRPDLFPSSSSSSSSSSALPSPLSPPRLPPQPLHPPSTITSWHGPCQAIPSHAVPCHAMPSRLPTFHDYLLPIMPDLQTRGCKLHLPSAISLITCPRSVLAPDPSRPMLPLNPIWTVDRPPILLPCPCPQPMASLVNPEPVR